MSIRNIFLGLAACAASSEAVLLQEQEGFGPRLTPQATSLRQGCMDAVWRQGILYVISAGRLVIYRTPVQADSKPLGEVGGLGGVRQIEVRGNLAFVTAREDGMWILDVADPIHPAVLSKYDSIELATGIAVEGDLALVACRNYGVELVDVSNPRQPRHLSTFPTGEAQSVVLRNGLAYIGDWAPRKVLVCDVRDPYRPKLVSSMDLGGFGDGVFVHGTICLAATGHHAPGLKRRDISDPAYGAGAGFDIFDVADPTQPKHLSRTNFPRFYSLGLDMWDVCAVGDIAVVNDTHNGLYLFDIRNPSKPIPKGCLRLPLHAKSQLPDSIGGIALGQGKIYLAGVRTGLYVVDVPEITPLPQSREIVRIPQKRPETPLPTDTKLLYRPEGQVHEIALGNNGNILYAAAGQAGLHAISLADGKASGRCLAATNDLAYSVDVQAGHVLLSEGQEGLSLWRETDDDLKLLGRYGGAKKRKNIGQVRLSPDARFAFVQVGPSRLEILDISDPGEIRPVLKDNHVGLFYRTPFGHGLMEGKRFICMWHVTGLFSFEADTAGGARISDWSYPWRIGTTNGAAAIGENLLVTHHLGYHLVNAENREEPKRENIIRIPGWEGGGKPTIFGNTLYIAHRAKRNVAAIDISDLHAPKLLWEINLSGNPGPILQFQGKALIPAGYQGVLQR